MAEIRVLLADDEPLVRRGLRRYLKSESDLVVVGEARNGLEALEAIQTLAPDLVFLDVQMPELSGVEVLSALPPRDRPAVIFVTAFDRYAVHAFDVHAIDYLLKPFDEPRFRTALGRARQRLADPSNRSEAALREIIERLKPAESFRDRFLVRVGGKIRTVSTDSVDWIEANDNHVRLHVGPDQHVIRETIRGVEQTLDPRRFVRIHRSTIINLDRLQELTPTHAGDWHVRLSSGTRLTLSRTYRAEFERRVGKPS